MKDHRFSTFRFFMLVGTQGRPKGHMVISCIYIQSKLPSGLVASIALQVTVTYCLVKGEL